MKNRVVARYADGRLLKGSTNDFVPTKDVFHVSDVNAGPGATPTRVQVRELKAVFFVKDFVGDREHKPRNDFEPGRAVTGKKIEVVFADGEVLVGTTQGYQPDRPGFFMVPADGSANTERCFVVMTATRSVRLL